MRDCKIDNAKGLLIFLVVFGHLLEAADGWNSSILHPLLTFIYMLHIPAFAFLAGITAKTKNIERRISFLIALLVIFQIAYVVPPLIIKGTYPTDILQPYWILWFLLAMVWWYAILPLAKRVSWPLTLSVGIALIVGTIPWIGYPLSLSRAFVFFPFFILGHLHGITLIKKVPVNPATVWAAPLITIVIAAFLEATYLSKMWFYGSVGYENLQTGLFEGIFTRVTLMLIAAIATISFLGLIPSKATILTRAGQSSLTIFLLHGFIINICRDQIFTSSIQLKEIEIIFASITISVIIISIFSMPIWDRYIRLSAEFIADQYISIRSKISTPDSGGD